MSFRRFRRNVAVFISLVRGIDPRPPIEVVLVDLTKRLVDDLACVIVRRQQYGEDVSELSARHKQAMADYLRYVNIAISL